MKMVRRMKPMTLIEGFVKDEIFVDFGSDILYGSDQQNVNYPSRFPTVGFQLMATYGLSQIVILQIKKDFIRHFISHVLLQ